MKQQKQQKRIWEKVFCANFAYTGSASIDYQCTYL